MKKLFLIGLLISFGNGALLAQAAKQNQVAVQHQVQELALRKFSWMVHRQLDSLELILDDRIRFVHSNGWIQNKSEMIEDLKSGKLSFQSMEATDLETRVFEGMAIVIGKGKFAGTLNGAPFNTSLLFTEIYVLNGKRWLLASRHANKLL